MLLRMSRAMRTRSWSGSASRPFLSGVSIVVTVHPSRPACGWFWFAFTGDLPTLGSTFARISIPVVGAYTTLWLALLTVVALPGIRDNRGFLIMLPICFTTTLHFTLEQWLEGIACIFTSNMVGNLLSGIVSDRLTWRRTVMFIGGIGSAVSTLVLYMVPTRLGPDGMFLTLCAGAFYGLTLAGYVPLSALMACLAPEEKPAAMSMLNLGAGASVRIGPAVVALFGVERRRVRRDVHLLGDLPAQHRPRRFPHPGSAGGGRSRGGSCERQDGRGAPIPAAQPISRAHWSSRRAAAGTRAKTVSAGQPFRLIFGRSRSGGPVRQRGRVSDWPRRCLNRSFTPLGLNSQEQDWIMR